MSPPRNRHFEQDSLMLPVTWLLYSIKLLSDGDFNGWMLKRSRCELFLSNVCMSSTLPRTNIYRSNNSDRFPLTYMNCLIGSCPSESLSSAESLANQFCRLANSTTVTSLSFPPVPQQTISATSNGGSMTSMVASSAPSNATGTNAAASSMGLGGYGFGGQGLVNGVIVMLSVILGVIVF